MKDWNIDTFVVVQGMKDHVQPSWQHTIDMNNEAINYIDYVQMNSNTPNVEHTVDTMVPINNIEKEKFVIEKFQSCCKNSTAIRTPAPVAYFGLYPCGSGKNAVPAISMCAHRVDSTKCDKKCQRSPCQRHDLSHSYARRQYHFSYGRYSGPSGNRHNVSPLL